MWNVQIQAIQLRKRVFLAEKFSTFRVMILSQSLTATTTEAISQCILELINEAIKLCNCLRNARNDV